MGIVNVWAAWPEHLCIGWRDYTRANADEGPEYNEGGVVGWGARVVASGGCVFCRAVWYVRGSVYIAGAWGHRGGVWSSQGRVVIAGACGHRSGGWFSLGRVVNAGGFGKPSPVCSPLLRSSRLRGVPTFRRSRLSFLL